MIPENCPKNLSTTKSEIWFQFKEYKILRSEYYSLYYDVLYIVDQCAIKDTTL